MCICKSEVTWVVLISHFGTWIVCVCLSICLCDPWDLLLLCPQMLEIDVYVDTW